MVKAIHVIHDFVSKEVYKTVYIVYKKYPAMQ